MSHDEKELSDVTLLLADAGVEGVEEYGAAKYRRGYLYALELAADAISDTAKALGLKDNSPVVKTFIDNVNALRDEH